MIIIQEYAGNGRKTRQCDAKCYNAVGKKCKCICGAVNHGKGIDFAVQNAMHILNLLQKNEPNKYFCINENINFLVNAIFVKSHLKQVISDL